MAELFGFHQSFLNQFSDKFGIVMSKVVETEGVLGGKPRNEGTRVSAERVYEMNTQKDMSPEEVADILPTVAVEDVKAAIQYMKDREDSEADVLA